MKKYSFVFAYIILLAIPSLLLFNFVYELIDLNALTILIFLSLFVGGILEIWAVRQGKKDKFYIWEYNKKTTLDKKILGVAVEDVILFLILTPIFIITMWEFVKKYVLVLNISTQNIFIYGTALVLVTYYLVFKVTNK